ncbi:MULTISPECIES: type VI secretion system lipoprotein TssJ [Enterobacterales]|uniref:type VI secretion system lipoprotein TssJ n=1 Tax=Enterobacterales TaxID=91347 RepID=UPI002EDA8D47
MMQKRAGKGVLGIVMLLALTACGSSTHQQSEPKTVEITLNAGKNCNPDRDGRAAPVQVLLFLLTNADNFNNSDYITLSTGASPALLNDTKNQQQFILKPGESRTIKLEAEKEIRFFGIAAAYRNIHDAQWNAVYSLPKEKPRHWYQKLIPMSDKPLKLAVTLDKLSVSIKEAN